MAADDSPHAARRLTARGAATRARIIGAAAELMHVKGVTATTLDDVLVASGTSKSQFRGHFSDKGDLVRSVIDFRALDILGKQRSRLETLDSFRGLERWRDALLQRNELRHGAWGCELGSLAAELSDVDEQARVALAEHFRDWERLLAEAFERMRDNGELSEDIEAVAMATSVMAAVQGGYLLAQTAHDSTPMRMALDMVIRHVRSYRRRR